MVQQESFIRSPIHLSLMQAQDRKTELRREKITLPAVFVGHGSPMVAIEYDDFSDQLCQFLQNIPRPNAIVIVSSHWQTANEIRITSNPFPDQIYDFEGYPDTLFQLTYPCEGNPQLAETINYLLSDMQIPVVLDDTRGIDHGVWVPLYVAFPDADIPVVQISIPKNAEPKDLLDIGQALSDLRGKGVLLIGSGNLLHNKNQISKEKYISPSKEILKADEWLRKHIEDLKIAKLSNYKNELPDYGKIHPDHYHLLPLFFILGAVRQKDYFVNIVEGFHYGNMSMRSFAFVSNE